MTAFPKPSREVENTLARGLDLMMNGSHLVKR